MNTNPSIGVAILTFNGMKHLPKCLTAVLNSKGIDKVLVIDSSSTDGTVEYVRKTNIELLCIPQSEFNHGLTREKARKYLNTDIVVMLTQDAYLVDESSIENLIKPIVFKKCAVTYGRQIPHDGAKFYESFPRHYNYPIVKSILQVRTMANLNIYGAKLFFCSDSFSAYANDKLDEIGGFPETLTHEDYLVSFKLLRNGYAIGYVSNAIVKHSHDYSLVMELKRHFDAGFVRGKFKELEDTTGKTEKIGVSFAIEFIKATKKQKGIIYIPYSLSILIAKYIGFKLGYFGVTFLPIAFKKRLSSHRFYWESIYVKTK
ncbi:MAG: glycosyltransferase family 2 protein [Bacteroidetes bacterium]|nr:glycosyltransferase family 2 protein [Bacteroidota bacterium]MBS1627763.1 glycosyltransferase family 2 protein [Bacteroidota bacterium]MBS1649828.1 glycosyltransferase family 2 protein [Bacteroidota bacterium]